MFDAFAAPWTIAPEKAAAPHSNALAWKIPWTEEPGGLQSMGSQRIGIYQESDTTERLHYHFSLLCIGEGTGNPLQCSFLENPRDGGAWRAAVSGVTQSGTRLKRLSSSSSKVSKNDACASTDTQTNLCAHIPHSFTHFLSLSPSLCLGRPALLVNSPNAVCLVYSIHTSALHRFKRITTYQELCISKALPNTS